MITFKSNKILNRASLKDHKCEIIFSTSRLMTKGTIDRNETYSD